MVAQGRMTFHQVAEIGVLRDAFKSHGYQIPLSYNTVKKYLMEDYENCLKEVKEDLNQRM